MIGGKSTKKTQNVRSTNKKRKGGMGGGGGGGRQHLAVEMGGLKGIAYRDRGEGEGRGGKRGTRGLGCGMGGGGKLFLEGECSQKK